jgi:N-acylneuraminate cytidylyltransferase
MDSLVKKKNLGIILARKGSKRIPNKNIIKFNNKPLIAWTIEAAIKSKIFDNIIVSTDSEKIKKIAIEYGADVPFKREEYHDDNSPSSLATWYMTNKIETEFGLVFENVFQLLPSCPFRNEKVIRKCYNYFKQNKISSLISCSQFSCLNPWWSFQMNCKDEANYLFPKKLNKRSQDLKKVFSISGAVWIIKNDRLKKYKTFYCPGHKFFPIDSLSALDIDTKDDLEFAKKINIK